MPEFSRLTYLVSLALATAAMAQEGTCVADDETCLFQKSITYTTRSQGISHHVPHDASRAFKILEEAVGTSEHEKPVILQQALQALMSVPALKNDAEAHQAMVRTHPALQQLVEEFPSLEQAIGHFEDPDLLQDLHEYMTSHLATREFPTAREIRSTRRKLPPQGKMISTVAQRLAKKKQKSEDTKVMLWYEGWGCGMNISVLAGEDVEEMPVFAPGTCFGHPWLNYMTVANDALFAILGNSSCCPWKSKYEIVVFFEDFEESEGGVSMVTLQDLGSSYPSGFFVGGGDMSVEGFFFRTMTYDSKTRTYETFLSYASPTGTANITGADLSNCKYANLGTGKCDGSLCDLIWSCSPKKYPGNYTLQTMQVNTTSLTAGGLTTILTLPTYAGYFKFVGDKLYWKQYYYDKVARKSINTIYSADFSSSSFAPSVEMTLPQGAYTFTTDGADLLTGKYEKYDSVAKKSIYTMMVYSKSSAGWTLANKFPSDGFNGGQIVTLAAGPETPEAEVLEPGIYEVK